MRFYSEIITLFACLCCASVGKSEFPKEAFYKFLAQQEQSEEHQPDTAEKAAPGPEPTQQQLSFILTPNLPTVTVPNIDYVFGSYNLFLGNP